jgi:hypothetical protein
LWTVEPPTPALQHDHRAVVRLPHARFLEQARQHLLLALREVGRRPVVSLLEHDDVEAGARELGRDDGAARARADHAHLRAQRDVVAASEQLLDHDGACRRSSGPA